ncbi:hypothetical protein MA16_Dca003540 [Dendrobium catenatum]|uniref:Uncharacterized protein n=1 Tax=Dendrobium catenatum TaxID=906689 RepID=A0A2I0V8P8_9ASPA|nr:hypothetical protein MA16_Dca028927 [Dendrobium catenatum]PKU74337.1 hypothetical protein MA16_Dca003540 [Dendrobium catenatum]
MTSIVAPGLVQAYVEKKLHMEKMKRMEEELGGRQDIKISDKKGKNKKKSSFFGLLRKKVYPNKFPKQAGSSMA